MHPTDFQAAITNARDFETAELKANHTQAVNLVMNRSSELDSKLKQFSDSINQKLEEYLKMCVCHYCGKQGHLRNDCSNPELPTQPSTILTNLLVNDTTVNISTTHISTSSLSTATTSNILTNTATNNLSDICSSNTAIKLSSNNIKKSQIKSHPKLEISDGCSPTDSQFIQPAIRITTVEFKNWVYSKPEFLELFNWKPTNNQYLPANIVLILNPDAFLDLEADPKEFHKHYQNLAPTREKQKQHLAQINTWLCNHCLIPYDFQYCNECDLIYNPPPCMIYTISEEEEPINSCASETESTFNLNLNSDNDDDKNNGSSSTQCGNEKYSDSNSDSNPKTYIALLNLTKEQELKWFSNNNEDIMPECVHDTDTGFDLRYPEKNSIKLEPYLHICIDFKIALEILATTMVQLASRNSLAKKRINIRGGIIDVEYIRNIIAMLQNDSEKTYIIDPNKKIAQAIFLLLVKIVQLVLVGNREELGITTRGIQEFRSTDRIDILVNMAEEEIIDKREIIFTLVIERKIKDQIQIFEAEATFCELGKIRLVNLYILAKNHSHIKIPIYNNTEDIIKIPERTTIEYLTTEIENQLSDTIPDFLQLCGYVDITSQIIYDLLYVCCNAVNSQLWKVFEPPITEFYPFKLSPIIRIAGLIKAYRIPPASHKIICQEINRMFDNGLIQPLMSPWLLPVILVCKKNEKIHFCYSQQLELNNNHFPAEFVFNFYVNNKITDCLRGTVNIESAKKNFYTELFQHTSLPRNYSFAPIIRKINQIIERYTQQQFPITYANKGKGRLQTPVKTRVKSPTNSLYYYTPGSTINISSTGVSTSHMTSTFGQFPFQSKQKKTEISITAILTRFWKRESLGNNGIRKRGRKKAEDQKFTYQNTILKNLKVETLNIKTQQTPNNLNPELINQRNLPLPQQQLQPPQQQQLNLDPMAYIPIAKLEKFISEEDDAQIWLNNVEKTIMTNGWNDAKALQAITYFLQDTTDSCSILQCIYLMYFIDLQAAITNARDFEVAELEANYTQAVNLVINESFDLDSKLKQFKTCVCHYCGKQGHLQINCHHHLNNQQSGNHSHFITSILSANSLTDDTSNLSATVITHLSAAVLGNLSVPTNSNTATELTSKQNPKAEINPTKLKIVDGSLPTDSQFFHTTKDAQSNNLETNQQTTLTSNILPATITENELLNAIFPFKFEKLSTTPLFSGTTLEEKPIIAMYTDAKVDGHSIKLILDSGLADSIIIRQLMNQLGCRIDCAASARIITTDGTTKTPIGKIDDFFIKVNSIIVSIKVLVMEAIQYQALIVATKTPNLTVLEFCHAIYTQNQSDLGLPEGCCPAESALTYYINARINYYIGKEEEPHDAKLGLYRELSQYTTKEVAVIAATIVKIHREIEQYANENLPISTGNTRERANKTKENLETNQESNQQKLETPAQTPKKTKINHTIFSPENKIQIPLGAASSSTSTPQTPKTPRDIPITGGYSSLFQNSLFQPKFRTGFENSEEESESESEKETSEKTITRPVTGTSSQSRNQETRDQEKEPNIREATFRNAQGNIIPSPLRSINPPAENGNEMTTPYIARLTDFSGEKKETDMHIWLREANNWNDQRAIQTLPFFLKGTANSWYQSLETKPTSFAKFKNALLEYFSDPNAVIQLQNEFNTIKQNTSETVTQYFARFNRIRRQIEAIEQGYYIDSQVLNQAIQTLPFFLKGTANSWYQSLETKPTSFAKFKNALLEYFSDPNAVIQLQNEFNTIKQNTSETIEAIEQGYYIDSQVLNQFIRGLKSSILGKVCPAHPNSLPEAITLTRALESAEKEANHSQMVNMVMEENKTETLEKRVTRLGEELSKKIESYLIPDLRKNTYQPPQRRSQEVSDSRNNHPSCQEFRTETRACHFCKRVGHLISQCRMRMMQEARENNYYTPPQMPRNQYMPIPRQYPTTYQNQGAYQQQPMIANPNWCPEAQNQPI
ncbi:hypothetical protein G9A89_022788 [Geosiphon pyriformis]|nr:hypothetical protein G9A89_022788 [Geosiphon pyriformis]